MYDVAIIGGGPAAIFAAYEFVMKYPKLKLVMLEAGNAIDKRFCPLAASSAVGCCAVFFSGVLSAAFCLSFLPISYSLSSSLGGSSFFPNIRVRLSAK